MSPNCKIFLFRQKKGERMLGELIYLEKFSDKKIVTGRLASGWALIERDSRLIFSWWRSLNSYVSDCRRTAGERHYTRTLSPAYLLLPPADLKVRGDSPPFSSRGGDTWEVERSYAPSLPRISSLSFSLFPARVPPASASLSLLLAPEESGSTPQGLHKGA